MTCPECGHPMIVEHDPDEACLDCDDLAQTGQYSPCADLGDGKVLIAGVLYDTETLEEADPQ